MSVRRGRELAWSRRRSTARSGILTGHAAMMTLLGTGELRLGSPAVHRFSVDGGFLQVVDNRVRIVTERAAAV